MKRIITATALSLALTSSLAWANTDPTTANTVIPAAKSSTAQPMRELTQVADQGFNAMRSIQYARLAIFSGNIELATKLTTQAAALLNDDSVTWRKFLTQTDNPELAKNDQFVVIDATITIDENYVITPEKQAVIDKANAKLASGDQQGALADLRLADIAVNETQYLMPLHLTQHSVNEALQLLNDGKYYEANIVLLNAQQAILVNSVTLINAD